MNVKWIRVDCPLCDCTFGNIILKKDYGVFRECRDCSIIYTTIRPSKEDYLSVSKTYIPTTSANKRAFDDRVIEANEDFERIEKHVEKGIVFDIGASSGIFLETARKRKWNVVGSEISQRCIKYAKQKFDIDLIYGYIEDLDIDEHKYELVTMIQVIEHLLTPIEDMSKIRNILKDDGYLYITTPTLAEDVELLKENHMLPYHTINFTKETLLKFINDSGFDIIFSERYECEKLPCIRVLCKKVKK